MRTKQTLLLPALLCALAATHSARTQIVVTASALPKTIGQYSRAYVSTNLDPSSLIGQPGGPQRWDFSQTPAPDETIRRLDIVAPSDSGEAASFPSATFAERYSNEGVGVQEWDFYSAASNRLFYGFYNPSFGDIAPASPAALDVPSLVSFGTNWSYVTDESLGLFTVHVTATASVDAYGTIVLPQIGEFQALRVNQMNSQQDFYSGFPIDSAVYFREYFWIVPGLGKAVDIISAYTGSPPPANFTSVFEARRMFEASSTTNAGAGISNVRLQVRTNHSVLSWNQLTNAARYRVEASASLSPQSWQPVALPASNSWSEALLSTNPARYYRVFALP